MIRRRLTDLRARRFLLLAGLAGGTVLGASATLAASPADTGSWGQAWGDETVVPESPPPQRRAAQPVAVAAPAGTGTAVTATPLPAGPSSAEIGGWGDAWGGEPAVQAQAPAPRKTVPAAPQPLAASSVTAAVPVSGGSGAAEIGGWGDAWGEGARPAARRVLPAAAPAQQVPVAGRTTPSQPAAEPPVDSASPAGAPDAEQPVQLTADQITHDRELGIVTARGRVEISQAGRTLVADQVNYNLKQDIISASGNVILTESTGEVLTTEYFELTGDLREGVAKEIRAILVDNSRMAAAGARRVGGNRTDFDKGVYTACEPCRKNPDRRPLWEVKAERITHDQDEKVIEYRDAWLELGGIPVAYTPYISHPDPTVKRKTGFLVPTGGTSSNLGTNVTVPYFWAIKDNQDLVFAPRFLFPGTAAGGDLGGSDNEVLRHLVLSGEHRWVGMNGEARTVASFTQDRHTGEDRGHIDATGRFDLNDSWRAGYEIARASDDTYNSVYSYSIPADRPWLTTRPYVESFGRRNYTRMEAFAFQGLRATDDPGDSPIVLPHITSTQMSMPDAKGGYYTFDNDVLAYSRSEGTGATRLSSQAGWHRPFMGSMGDITTVSTSLRADAYHAEEVTDYGTTNAGRAVPEISANWRMPFVRESRSFAQVLEPMAMVAASPNGGNSSKIPNEDSIGFELDELNVFRPNRLPGIDRVEGGLRGAYGLRWQAFPGQGGWINAALAQGWRAHDDSTFGEGSGFEDTLSDILGRLDISPSSNFSLLNRLRLDKDTGDIRRTENSLSVGSPLLRAAVTYLMLDRSEIEGSTFPRRHYVSWELSSALTRNWSATGGIRYDLTEEGGPIGWNTRLIYNDECFAFYTDLRQDYTYDRDDLGGFSLSLNVVFKTLGDIPFNVF